MIDPKKSPFLSPATPYLVISFNVKLTDSCWASEIYQVGKVLFVPFSWNCLSWGRVLWAASIPVSSIQYSIISVGGAQCEQPVFHLHPPSRTAQLGCFRVSHQLVQFLNLWYFRSKRTKRLIVFNEALTLHLQPYGVCLSFLNTFSSQVYSPQ